MSIGSEKFVCTDILLGSQQTVAKTPDNLPATPVDDSQTESDDAAGLPEVHRKLNDRIQRIHEQLPRGTVFIIFTGTADPRQMSYYQAKRTKFTNMTKTIPQSEIPPDVFTENDMRTLEAEVMKSRMGLSFFCVK